MFPPLSFQASASLAPETKSADPSAAAAGDARQDGAATGVAEGAGSCGKEDRDVEKAPSLLQSLGAVIRSTAARRHAAAEAATLAEEGAPETKTPRTRKASESKRACDTKDGDTGTGSCSVGVVGVADAGDASAAGGGGASSGQRNGRTPSQDSNNGGQGMGGPADAADAAAAAAGDVTSPSLDSVQDEGLVAGDRRKVRPADWIQVEPRRKRRRRVTAAAIGAAPTTTSGTKPAAQQRRPPSCSQPEAKGRVGVADGSPAREGSSSDRMSDMSVENAGADAGVMVGSAGDGVAGVPGGLELIPGFEDTIDSHFMTALLQDSDIQSGSVAADAGRDAVRKDSEGGANVSVGLAEVGGVDMGSANFDDALAPWGLAGDGGGEKGDTPSMPAPAPTPAAQGSVVPTGAVTAQPLPPPQPLGPPSIAPQHELALSAGRRRTPGGSGLKRRDGQERGDRPTAVPPVPLRTVRERARDAVEQLLLAKKKEGGNNGEGERMMRDQARFSSEQLARRVTWNATLAPIPIARGAPERGREVSVGRKGAASTGQPVIATPRPIMGSSPCIGESGEGAYSTPDMETDVGWAEDAAEMRVDVDVGVEVEVESGATTPLLAMLPPLLPSDSEARARGLNEGASAAIGAGKATEICSAGTTLVASSSEVRATLPPLPRKAALRFMPRDELTWNRVSQRGYHPAQQLKAPVSLRRRYHEQRRNTILGVLLYYY